MNKLTSYTIKELHKAYRDKLLTPTSYVDLCLIKIKQKSELNAFVTITEDIAENHGVESEKRIYIEKKTKPLDGVTIGIKDNFCTNNIRTTCASNMLKNFIPTYDATVYSRLRDAGACLVGKCNLDEFAMGSGTVDSIFGPTRNPWKYKTDDWRIAGGSSGGSAVAVASGTCVAAMGSDTAPLTTEILSQLNITIENLPQKCQHLLDHFGKKQIELNIKYDPISITQQQTKEISSQLEEEYEVLELKQKNQELRRRIEVNKKIIEDLKKEIAESKDGLIHQKPNPETIQEHIRQTKQKLASYETNSYERAKANFASLQVPPHLLPSALSATAARTDERARDATRLALTLQRNQLQRTVHNALNTLFE